MTRFHHGVILALVGGFSCQVQNSTDLGPAPEAADLSPGRWAEDYAVHLDAQAVDRSSAGSATGTRGAVTVAYNGLAARAGLEAIRQGGNAMDAALTTAMMQVALTGGAPISYFGILSLVYYDAESGRVHTMNANWNTILEEYDPTSIPGRLDMSTEEGLLGTEPSGRTALVGGFMKGVESAHQRFGRLPFATLFEPSIHVAEEGMPVSAKMAGYIALRADDLYRLPEPRSIYFGEDDSVVREGDVLRQPQLAATLRGIAENGADWMYGGPWGERCVAAVRADGGKMTLADLEQYEVLWSEPLVAEVGEYAIHTLPPPNRGGIAMIEAQRLAAASGLVEDGHWSESGASLRKALDITQMFILDYLPAETLAVIYPGMDFSDGSRVTAEHGAELWRRMSAGAMPMNWKPLPPKHSDDVVAIDAEGNIAAITQSINCVLWGKTAIIVDGITIGDPASFQQAAIAAVDPGGRLPDPTETGILFRDGEPVMGFASMGSGLHQRTFQGLLNVTRFGMSVDQAIDAPDFFMTKADPATGQLTARGPAGRFPPEVLEACGYAFEEIDPKEARFNGEGIWVAIHRDPRTGELHAASHNRNNSDAVAD